MPRTLALLALLATGLSSQAAAQEYARHSLAFAGGFGYSLGHYSEVEWSGSYLHPVSPSVRLQLGVTTSARYWRTNLSALWSPRVAGVRPYVGAGVYAVPARGGSGETRRVGGLGLAGLDLPTGRVGALDTFLYVEGQVLTAAAVRAPLVLGLRLTPPRSAAPSH